MLLPRLIVAAIAAVAAGRCGAAEPASHLWPPPEEAIVWSGPGANRAGNVTLQLLGFNDFHGNLQIPVTPFARAVGGAAALAAYLKAAAKSAPQRTLILHAGDLVGASPPATRLLRNEPGIEFLNLLADRHCHFGWATRPIDTHDWRRHPNTCNVVGTLGNHEFDAGIGEIHRLLDGGNSPDGPFLEHRYRGSRVPYVCSNVRLRASGQLLLPAYTVVTLGGIPVGVIGAVLRETPSIVPAWAVRDVEFLDEAQSINQAAAELEAQGVHTLIVIIHQGLTPLVTDHGIEYQGPLRQLVAQLDPDIDVVVSGHTHNLTNTLLPSRSGSPVLVTQAYSYGEAFEQIELQVDPATRDVVAKSARIVPTWADVAPGLPGDSQALRLTERAQALVAAKVGRAVGTLRQPIGRMTNEAGESALGDLVADAQRSATHADIALMNPGGLRADLRGGALNYGDLLTLHPFGNHLVTLDMTGEQLLAVLEQQWPREGGVAGIRILKTSGLRYSWDATKTLGSHVRAACDASGAPIDPIRHYRVTVNDFLAAGGDNFTLLSAAGQGEVGPLDTDALGAYLHEHAPTSAPDGRRLSRADLGGPQVCQPP
ncbi:MAG TPA: bifunctional metallophosphatase/5'-nucleotidase [Steroidobacteraceae bacterium]|jgi:5'-nucleotidase|nr:bifunctional metallophosphatase/5'-nucleotidase [Steroidobacteraceae bacterium]